MNYYWFTVRKQQYLKRKRMKNRSNSLLFILENQSSVKISWEEIRLLPEFPKWWEFCFCCFWLFLHQPDWNCFLIKTSGFPVQNSTDCWFKTAFLCFTTSCFTILNDMSHDVSFRHCRLFYSVITFTFRFSSAEVLDQFA